MQTRIFKSGNSLAVRIPKEIAFAADIQNVEIERKGSNLLIRPVHTESLGDVMKIFSSFPKSYFAQGREFHSQKERDWSQIIRPVAKKRSKKAP